jgi:GNAT superfamily N-acetyltransferase
MSESAKRQRRESSAWCVPLRAARGDELDLLFEIDRDASRLFERAGLTLALPNELELAAAERRRWLKCLRAGTTLIALNWAGEPVGFAAMWALDGEPYLEQLSVRTRAMRRGIGSALLSASERLVQQASARSLWLTTYRHLSWNRPFYERAGFAVVAPDGWGQEMAEEVRFQRRLLPDPHERVVMRKMLGVMN